MSWTEERMRMRIGAPYRMFIDKVIYYRDNMILQKVPQIHYLYTE
jgi:hypothetical protein